jgi:hypothetical protein
MTTPGGQTQVFLILRVWSEPREIPGAPRVWRLFVEHLPSGERRYLRSIPDLTEFLREYLPELPVGGSWWRLRKRLMGTTGGRVKGR